MRSQETNRPALPLPLRIFYRVEDGALLLLVSMLVLLCCSQIAARNLGIDGLVWTENAIRMNVLWLAMFGALRASREQNHIRIDLLSHHASAATRKVAHFLSSLGCSILCGIAGWYSYRFVASEYGEGATAFLNIPVWLCEAIIPFALVLMAVRFLTHSLTPPDRC